MCTHPYNLVITKLERFKNRELLGITIAMWLKESEREFLSGRQLGRCHHSSKRTKQSMEFVTEEFGLISEYSE